MIFFAIYVEKGCDTDSQKTQVYELDDSDGQIFYFYVFIHRLTVRFGRLNVFFPVASIYIISFFAICRERVLLPFNHEHVRGVKVAQRTPAK